jgi:ribonuclease HI
MIKIYTDGSCIGNPGSGGWAAIILNGDKQDIISGRKKNTTNNQMELMAAIKALVFFSKKQKIRIYTDSNYVKEGITNWIKIWEKNNWKTANKKKVKNIELWIKLNTLSNFHDIEWKWVKAHSGDPMNNMVDKLARKAALI